MDSKMKMSIQMMKAIMFAFHASIQGEKDIMEIFQGFEIVDTLDGLVVLNPPVLSVKAPKEEEEETEE